MSLKSCCPCFGRRGDEESWFDPADERPSVSPVHSPAHSPRVQSLDGSSSSSSKIIVAKVHNAVTASTTVATSSHDGNNELAHIKAISELENALREREELTREYLAKFPGEGMRLSHVINDNASGDSTVDVAVVVADSTTDTDAVKKQKQEQEIDSLLHELTVVGRRVVMLEETLRGMTYSPDEEDVVDEWSQSQQLTNRGEDEAEVSNHSVAAPTTSDAAGVGHTWQQKLNTMDSTQGTLSVVVRSTTATATATTTTATTSSSSSSSPASASSSSSSSPSGLKSRSKSIKNVLHVKQKWPDWLVDESYEVTKVTKFGLRYHRVLKLTQYHVLACSENKGVTKVYPYLDLVDVRVNLTSGNESVTLVFKKSGGGDNKTKSNRYCIFQYSTSMASIIASQITTRLKLRRVLSAASNQERASTIDMSGALPLLDPAVTDSVLASITSANSKSKASATLAFAESLVENLVPSKNETNITGNRSSVRVSGATCNSPKRPLSSSGNGSGSDREMKEEEEEEAMARRLMVVSRLSPEYYVQQAVMRVMHEGPSAEHDTRSYFLESTKSQLAVLETSALQHGGSLQAQEVSAVLKGVRMWIEGMHEYLLLQRAQALATIYIWSESLPLPSPAAIPNPNPNPAPGTPGTPGTSSGRSARSGSVLVVDQISKADLNEILDKHLQHQHSNKGASGQGQEGGGGSKSNGDDGGDDGYNPLTFLPHTTLLSISFVTYSIIEESVYAALKQHILKVVQASDDVAARDAALTAKIKDTLSTRSQEEWEIPDANISPLGWELAISELDMMETHITPSKKLSAIVVAAKNIFAEYATVKGPAAEPLGADDLVPIFIYVLAQTGLKDILSTLTQLWSLCHPSLLHGESGYYLTVYEGAALFLEDYQCDSKEGESA